MQNRMLIVGQSKELDPKYLENRKDIPSNPNLILFSQADQNFRVPYKLRDDQLAADLNRGKILGNRITVNGESFSDSPEYNPQDLQYSLKQFLKRALYKYRHYNEEEFDQNFQALDNYWSQGIASISINLMDRSHNGLMLNDVYTITDIKLDSHGKPYVEIFQLNFAPRETGGKTQHNTPPIAWHLPGILTMTFDFSSTTQKRGAKTTSINPSNQILKALILHDGSPLADKGFADHLQILINEIDDEITNKKTKASKGKNLSPAEMKEIAQLQQKQQSLKKELAVTVNNNIPESEKSIQEIWETELQHLESIILTYSIASEDDKAKLEIAQSTYSVLVKLKEVNAIPFKDLSLYFSTLSLLRLSLQHPKNKIFLVAYKQDFEIDLIAESNNTWASQLIISMNQYIAQASKPFYLDSINQIQVLNSSSVKDHNLSRIVDNVIKEMEIAAASAPDRQLELIDSLSYLTTCLRQNNLFDAVETGFITDIQSLSFYILEFKEYFIQKKYIEKFAEIENIIGVNEKNTDSQPIGIRKILLLIKEKYKAVNSDELNIEKLKNIELLTSALMLILTIHLNKNNPDNLVNYKESAFKEFPEIASAISGLIDQIIEGDFLRKHEIHKKRQIGLLKKKSSLQGESLQELYQSTKKKSPEKARRATLLMSKMMKLVSQIANTAKKGALFTKEENQQALETLNKLHLEEETASSFDNQMDTSLATEVAELLFDIDYQRLESLNKQSELTNIIHLIDEIKLLIQENQHLNPATYDKCTAIINVYIVIHDLLINEKSAETASAELHEILDAEIKTYRNKLSLFKSKITDEAIKKNYNKLINMFGTFNLASIADELVMFNAIRQFTLSNDFNDVDYFDQQLEIFLSKPNSAQQEKITNFQNAIGSLRAAKANKYYELYNKDVLLKLPENDMTRNTIHEFVNTFSNVINNNEIDLNPSQIANIQFNFLRFIRSNSTVKCNKFAESLEKQLQVLLEESVTSELKNALYKLKTAFNVDPYKILVGFIEQLEIINLIEKNSLIDALTMLNLCNLNHHQIQINAIEIFDNFYQAVDAFNVYAEQSDQKTTIMQKLATIAYIKVFTAVRNIAHSFAGIEPTIAGYLINLLNEANKLKNAVTLKMNEKDVLDLIQILINVAVGLTKPEEYTQIPNCIYVTGLINGSNTSYKGFAHIEPIVSKLFEYAKNEAEYIKADKELKIKLEKPNQSVLLVDSVRQVHSEVSRIKHIQASPDRVPKLTNTLKQMTALLNNPRDQKTIDNTISVANDIGKMSWGKRILAATGMVFGAALCYTLALIPVGAYLIKKSVDELIKQDELNHTYNTYGRMNVFTRQAAKTAQKELDQELIQNVNKPLQKC